MSRFENGSDWLRWRRKNKVERQQQPESKATPKPFTMVVTDAQEPIFSLINKVNLQLKALVEEGDSEGKVAVFYPFHITQGTRSERITELVLEGKPLLDAEIQAQHEEFNGKTPKGQEFTLRPDEIAANKVFIDDSRTELESALVEVIDIWTRSHPGRLLMVPDTMPNPHWTRYGEHQRVNEKSPANADEMVKAARVELLLEANIAGEQRTYSTYNISLALDRDDVIGGVGVTSPKNTLISRDLNRQKDKHENRKYRVRNIYPDMKRWNQGEEDAQGIYYLSPEDALLRKAQIKKVADKDIVITKESAKIFKQTGQKQKDYEARYNWIDTHTDDLDMEAYKNKIDTERVIKSFIGEDDSHVQWKSDLTQVAITTLLEQNPKKNLSEDELLELEASVVVGIQMEEERWNQVIAQRVTDKLFGLTNPMPDENSAAARDAEYEYMTLLSRVLGKEINDPDKIGGEFYLATLNGAFTIAEKLQEFQREDPTWRLSGVITDMYAVGSGITLTDENIEAIRVEEDAAQWQRDRKLFEEQFFGGLGEFEQLRPEPGIGNETGKSIGEQEQDKDDRDIGEGNDKGKSK